jgi:glycerol-3-phosphate O-acyltransferase
MKSKSYITSFLREIAIVVIGVLIALFISNWNEGIRQKKILNKTLFAISEEIKANKTDLEKVLQRHILTIDSIKANLENDTLTVTQMFVRLGGFQAPEIKNIGLRFFISNNAELVDYELISDLSEIEFANKGFELKLNTLVDYVYDQLDNKTKKSKLKILVLLSDVVESEEGLSELYDEFLSKHEVSLKQSAKRK